MGEWCESSQYCNHPTGEWLRVTNITNQYWLSNMIGSNWLTNSVNGRAHLSHPVMYLGNAMALNQANLSVSRRRWGLISLLGLLARGIVSFLFEEVVHKIAEQFRHLLITCRSGDAELALFLRSNACGQLLGAFHTTLYHTVPQIRCPKEEMGGWFTASVERCGIFIVNQCVTSR